jgi:hypothetical protein
LKITKQREKSQIPSQIIQNSYKKFLKSAKNTGILKSEFKFNTRSHHTNPDTIKFLNSAKTNSIAPETVV